MSDSYFHQLFDKESSTYTYLLADLKTKKAILIDSVLEQVERDSQLLKELGLELEYILETHVHADHLTGARKLKEWSGGHAQIALSNTSGAQNADLMLADGQTFKAGNLIIKAIQTPGHTGGCISYFVEDKIFTGDTLFIRGCGRTDFQQGDARQLFSVVREKIFSLPDETVIYPGHDYKGRSYSTVAQEKKYNPRLKLENSVDDFVKIMDGLNLAYPKKIDQAVPYNIVCGHSM